MSHYRMGSVFPTAYGGKCKVCGERIPVGGYVTTMRSGTGIRHPKCQEPE